LCLLIARLTRILHHGAQSAQGIPGLIKLHQPVLGQRQERQIGRQFVLVQRV
jgi:hypothetical protein